MSVATRATLIEVTNASRGPSASQALLHQSSVKPRGGHDSDVAVLNDRIDDDHQRQVQEREAEPREDPQAHAAERRTGSSADRFTGLSKALQLRHRQQVDDDDHDRPERERRGEWLVRGEQRARDEVADELGLAAVTMFGMM